MRGEKVGHLEVFVRMVVFFSFFKRFMLFLLEFWIGN